MDRIKFNAVIETDQKLVEQMKRAYLNCPKAVKYCQSLNIKDEEIDANIAKVFAFVSDLNYCSHCPGIKNCQKNNPTLCTKIIYTNGVLDDELVPCKELLKLRVLERQFIEKDFPDEWLNNNLKTIDKTNKRGEVIIKYSEYLKDNKVSGIFINGLKNTGRSFLAATICVDLAKKEKGPICFLDAKKHIRELNDLAFSKEKEEFNEKLRLYSNVPVLVLDDFGNEYITDYVRDTIINPIISERANKKLMTIFTSDFTIREIETLYAGSSKAGAIKAKQFANTLRSMCGNEINLGEIAIY